MDTTNKQFDFYFLVSAVLMLWLAGCDGVLGSGKNLDHCGVCGGDNTSCKIVSGIYTRRHLPQARYSFLTIVPKGACNLNITELKRSRNHIALKIRGGGYILNGNWRMQSTGAYYVGGTKFVYDKVRGSCPGGCVSAEGPINVTIEVQLLSYGVNPGIYYQFTVPKDLLKSTVLGTVIGNKNNHQSSGRHNSHRKHDSKRHHHRRHKHLYRGLAHSRPNGGSHSRHILKLKGTAEERMHAHSEPRFRQPIILDETRVRSRDKVATTSTEKTGGLSSTNPRAYSELKQTSPSEQTRPVLLLDRQANSLATRDDDVDSLSTVDKYRNRLATSANSVLLDYEDFKWKIVGFGECSLTCGGGLQETTIICTSGNSQVTDENCNPDKKPKPQSTICNTQVCPPGWWTDPWTECSTSCGFGMQRRVATCKQIVSSTVQISMSADKCRGLTKPSRSQVCKQKPCQFWKTGNWTKCSTECGRGQRKRRVSCVDHGGRILDDRECRQRKPTTKEICDHGPCAKGWYHTKWSTECTTDCGTGQHLREVYCAGEDGTELDEKRCPAHKKPRSRKTCKNSLPCGGVWFTGSWSKCSASCGNATRARDLVCIKKLSSNLFLTVGEENCNPDDKPKTTELCTDLLPCPTDWYMTEWSQCSVSCGGGYKTRDVKCVSEKFVQSKNCPAGGKSAKRRHCNTDKCSVTLADDSSGSKCTDYSESICEIVFQARMCRYSYYKSKCCHSCRQFTSKRPKT